MRGFPFNRRYARRPSAWTVLLALLAVVVSQAGAAPPVLVDGAWLERHLNDGQVVVVDMSSEEVQYTRFHIPGAVRLSFRQLVRVRKKDGVPVSIGREALARLLGRLGVSREDHVVIYDDMGGLNAGRLFWELERIGHPRVSVLNGGLVRWVLDGRPVDNKPVRRAPVTYRAEGKGRDNLVRLPEIRDLVRSGGAVLLDVRTREEYTGDPRKRRTGHIPGARWWPWDRSLDVAGGFVLREPGSLRKELAGLGLTDPKAAVVVYCRTGHRAAQSYLTLRSLGWQRVKLYDGSMAEYSRVSDAPVRQGMTP